MRSWERGEGSPPRPLVLLRGPRADTATDSIWVFLLLGMEAIRTYRTNPHLVIATHNVPTWTTPLALCLVISALVPNTSLLGHLCGLGVGYLGTCCASWIPMHGNLLTMRPNKKVVSDTSSFCRRRKGCCGLWKANLICWVGSRTTSASTRKRTDDSGCCPRAGRVLGLGLPLGSWGRHSVLGLEGGG